MIQVSMGYAISRVALRDYSCEKPQQTGVISPFDISFYTKINNQNSFRLFISLNYNLTKIYEIRVFHYKRNKYTKPFLHIHKEKA